MLLSSLRPPSQNFVTQTISEYLRRLDKKVMLEGILGRSDCFARHYHWPNTFFPSATALPNWIQSAIPGKLVLESIEDHGIRRCPISLSVRRSDDSVPDYPRTLREWARYIYSHSPEGLNLIQNAPCYRRLNKNFIEGTVSKLQDQYPQLKDPHNLEAFKRKWLYMFAYAEDGYARAYTSLNCWTFTRPVSQMFW